MSDADFDRLIEEALKATIGGWDFSWLQGRLVDEQTSWDYWAEVAARLDDDDVLLDIGTGGGERLSRLLPREGATVAIESYAPNVPIAAQRLRPLGAHVVFTDEEIHNQYGRGPGPDGLNERRTMPFPDGVFDVVISRHTSFSATEVRRILRPSGRLITQQVGEYYPELGDHLGKSDPDWGPKLGQDPPPKVEDVGLHVVRRLDESPASVFKDIGAVVYYLRMVPWNITNFSVDTHRDRLRALHEHIKKHGGLKTHYRHFFYEAIKP